jgi:hypothetical protein
MNKKCLTPFLFLTLFLSSCFFGFHKKDEDSKTLTHVVLCWLKEPGNSEQRKQIIEMTESFRDIPSVLDARAGLAIKSDRAIVDDSFDVGIVVEVRNEDDLKKYLDHPIHQNAKKDVLLPLVDRVLVYDFSK